MCVALASRPVRPAQTSVAVFVNGRFFLFDAGDGSLNAIDKQAHRWTNRSGVCDHFHSDHFADLGEVISEAGLWDAPALRLWAGRGQEIVDGFTMA